MMNKSNPNWIGIPLEVIHSFEEAQQRHRNWLEKAACLPGAEVCLWAFRTPNDTELFVLYSQDASLIRQRTRPSKESHELLADPSLGWLRQLSFELRRWQSGYALVHKKSRSLRQASADTEYDPEEWDLVAGAWDHDHCTLCWAYICSHADHGFPEAYFSLEGHGSWVCPSCFQQRIAGWSALPISSAVNSRSVSDANG